MLRASFVPLRFVALILLMLVRSSSGVAGICFEFTIPADPGTEAMVAIAASAGQVTMASAIAQPNGRAHVVVDAPPGAFIGEYQFVACTQLEEVVHDFRGWVPPPPPHDDERRSIRFPILHAPTSVGRMVAYASNLLDYSADMRNFDKGDIVPAINGHILSTSSATFYDGSGLADDPEARMLQILDDSVLTAQPLYTGNVVVSGEAEVSSCPEPTLPIVAGMAISMLVVVRRSMCRKS